MAKHILMWTVGERDSIEVYHEEASFLVVAPRKDLSHLSAVEEANKAGIYIIWSTEDNQRYIGQASSKVLTRLLAHDRSKDWWDYAVFFGRTDGHLDKAQLDYLEGKLIALFKEMNFVVANATCGNNSYCSPYQRGISEALWATTARQLREVVRLHPFKMKRNKPKGVWQAETMDFQKELMENDDSPSIAHEVPPPAYLVEKGDSALLALLASKGAHPRRR